MQLVSFLIHVNVNYFVLHVCDSCVAVTAIAG